MRSVPRAEWDDPVLQDDVEAEVANAIHRRDLEQSHSFMTATAQLYRAKAEAAKKERDKHDKGDLAGNGQRLWYKFHGQCQGYASAAKHLETGAARVWSRLAEGETVL